MTKTFRYEILFNANKYSNKKLHQSLNIMIVDNKDNKYIFSKMPLIKNSHRQDYFEFENLNFAEYMNSLSNMDWISSSKIQFEIIDDVLTFINLIRNYLEIIEIDGSLSKWDNATSEMLPDLIQSIIEHNLYFLNN